MADTDSQAASNGRPVDWAAELARHGRWLRTVIFARVGDREWTEDVFQEVSLAAVEQKAPLSDPAKAAPWLYQLAVNQSLASPLVSSEEFRRELETLSQHVEVLRKTIDALKQRVPQEGKQDEDEAEKE